MSKFSRNLLLALAMCTCLACEKAVPTPLWERGLPLETEAELARLENDPEKRAWAIERANYLLQALRNAGVRLPEVSCEAEEIQWLEVYPGDREGEFDWRIETTQVSVALTDQGDLTSLNFPFGSESQRKYFDHSGRLDSEPDYGLFLQNADQLSTESMRTANELIMQTLYPDDAQNFRMGRETISRRTWKSGAGISSNDFEGFYSYHRLVHGLPCDGSLIMIRHDRISGMLRNLQFFSVEADFPSPSEIKIAMPEAKEIARHYILKKYWSASETVVSCGMTKMTFVKLGEPDEDAVWDHSKPRIAHKVRIHWRPFHLDGWYTDDVTVDAIGGEVLDLAHYMSIARGSDPAPIPREECPEMN